MKKKMILAGALLTLGFSVPMISNANSVNEVVLAANADTEVTYQEVAKEQVPETITKTISEEFTDYSMDKFYIGSDDTYKVEISKSDEKWAVFFDTEGKISKKEDLSMDSAQETPVSKDQNL